MHDDLNRLITVSTEKTKFTAFQLEFLRERWAREAADSHEAWTRSNVRRIVFNLMATGGTLVVAALAGASIPNTSVSTYVRIATLVVSLIAAIGTAGARVIRPKVSGSAARIAYFELKAVGWKFLAQCEAVRLSTGTAEPDEMLFKEFRLAVEGIINQRERDYLRAAEPEPDEQRPDDRSLAVVTETRESSEFAMSEGDEKLVLG